MSLCNITNYQKEIYVKKSSKNFRYQIHTVYGPEHPVQGCEIQFLVSFLKFSDETEFLNQVQYDIFVVDDNIWEQQLKKHAQKVFSSSIPGINRFEASFNLIQINNSQFTSLLRNHKNIIIINDN